MEEQLKREQLKYDRKTEELTHSGDQESKEKRGQLQTMRSNKNYERLYRDMESQAQKAKELEEAKQVKTPNEAWKLINRFRKKREDRTQQKEINVWRDHFKNLLEGEAVDTVDNNRNPERNREVSW